MSEKEIREVLKKHVAFIHRLQDMGHPIDIKCIALHLQLGETTVKCILTLN